MKSKREKLTLVKFTAVGYGGHTGNVKITSALTYNVLFFGGKNIEERVEEERKKVENHFRKKCSDSQFEIRVKSKIMQSFHTDYFAFDEEQKQIL